MCALVVLYVWRYSHFKIDAFIVLLITFNICVLVTHLINLDFSNLPKSIFLMSLVAFFIYEFSSTTKNKNIIVYLVLIAGLMFSFIYVIHYRKDIFNIRNLFTERLGGFFDDENELGKEFGMFGCISLILAFKQRKIYTKIPLFLVYFYFFFLILTTGSISNTLTSILVSILIAIFIQKTIKGKLITAGVTVLAIATIIVLLQLPTFQYFNKRISDIFETLFNGGNAKEWSTFSRFDAVIQSFRIGANRIVFGFGYMSATDYTYSSIQSHNNFAELFIDFGFVGLNIFEMFLLIPSVLSKYKEKKTYVYAIILYMFIFQFFLTTYYKKFEYIFIAYAFAVHFEDSRRGFLFPFKNIVPIDTFDYDSSKKTIFEIIPALTPVGGAETFVTNFSIALKKKYGEKYNIFVVFLYKKESNFLNKKLERNKINIIQLRKRKGVDLFCSLELRRYINYFKPSIVHTHLYALTTTRLSLIGKKNKPSVFHTIHHNFPASQNKQHELLIKLIQKEWLTPICVAKIPSKEYGDYLCKEVKYINNGVCLENYSSEKPLKKREIDFLMVSRLVEIKNHMFILKLIKNHSKEFNSKLIILGDGDLYDELHEYCRKNKIVKRIEFMGMVNNVEEYMANSKILLMPSLNEGNPMVINEAFASGMLVIGNDVGGIHDLLVDKKNSCLIKLDDEDKFYSCMITLLNKINSNSIKKNCVNLDDISIEKTVDEYMEVFACENI